MNDSYHFMKLIEEALANIEDVKTANRAETEAGPGTDKERERRERDALRNQFSQMVQAQGNAAQAGQPHIVSYRLLDLMFRPGAQRDKTDALDLSPDPPEYLIQKQDPILPFACLEQAVPMHFMYANSYGIYHGATARRIKNAWIEIRLKDNAPDFTGCTMQLSRTDRANAFQKTWKWPSILYAAVQEMLRGEQFSVTYQRLTYTGDQVSLQCLQRDDGPVLVIRFPD